MDQPPRKFLPDSQRDADLLAPVFVDGGDDTTRQLRQKFEALAPFLDERMRRLWAGAEAQALGRGGLTAVAHATGLSRATVRAGVRELEVFRDDPGQVAAPRRVRRPGAGRPALTDTDPTLLDNLDHLFSPPPRASGPSPLRWTCESSARLASILSRAGHPVTSRTVALLLRHLGFELRCPRGPSADRDQARRKGQFECLGSQVEDFLRRGQPVIAVEGARTEGAFLSEHLLRRIPRGDDARQAPAAPPVQEETPARGSPWESLTADRVLAEFAVECVARWWLHWGRRAFPAAGGLLLAADIGRKGSREPFFGALLQGLADEIGLPLRVSHHPPGTSKWTRTGQQVLCTLSTALSGQAPATYGVRVCLVGDPAAAEGAAPSAGAVRQGFLPGVNVPEEGGQTPPPGGRPDEWNTTFLPR